MNYKIITDSKVLDNFISWLPELTEDETYYLCLFARSKYVQGMVHIRSDKIQMKRFTSNKARLVDKIRQLEVPLGSYKQKELEIPQEALALYITPNPRSFYKAGKQSLIKLANLVTRKYEGWNPHQEVMSEIQKAKSRTCIVDFDFDTNKQAVGADTLMYGAIGHVNKEAIHLLETRGGWHLMVAPNMVEEKYRKTWYNGIKEMQKTFSTDTDNHGDSMIPVPGCYQGGFTPFFNYEGTKI